MSYELKYRIYSKQWFKKPSDGYEFNQLPKYFMDWYIKTYYDSYTHNYEESVQSYVKSIKKYFWFDYNEQKVFVSRQHTWTGDYIE